MLVDVKKKHIRDGRKPENFYSGDRCCVALALRDAGVKVKVQWNDKKGCLTMYDTAYNNANETRRRKSLPRSCYRFCKQIQNSEKVEPFRFRIDVPGWSK